MTDMYTYSPDDDEHHRLRAWYALQQEFHIFIPSNDSFYAAPAKEVWDAMVLQNAVLIFLLDPVLETGIANAREFLIARQMAKRLTQ